MVSPKQKADDIKRFLFKSYRKDIKVISEVSFLHYGLQGRVDILCIDKNSICIHEIKSDYDSIATLEAQIKLYSTYCNELYIDVGKHFFNKHETELFRIADLYDVNLYKHSDSLFMRYRSQKERKTIAREVLIQLWTNKEAKLKIKFPNLNKNNYLSILDTLPYDVLYKETIKILSNRYEPLSRKLGNKYIK